MPKTKGKDIVIKGMGGRLLKGFAQSLLADIVIKPLTSAAAVIFMWGFHAIMKVSSKEGQRIIQMIAKVFQVSPEEWVPWVTETMHTITGAEFKAEDLVKAGTTGAVSDILEKFSSKVMTKLLNTIVEPGIATPEKSLKSAANFMSVNMQFQMSSWLLHLLGDVFSFGIFKSLKDLPNAISWSFGIGWLSWLVLGTPFQESIVTGLRWMYRDQLRTARFTEKQATDALKMGLITPEEWNLRLQQEGWREEDKSKLFALFETDLGEDDIRDAYLSGFMSIQDARKELNRRGLSNTRAMWKLSWWKYEQKYKLYSKLVSEYEDLYIQGKVDASELKPHYANLGYDNFMIDTAIDILNAKKVKSKELSEARLIDAWEENIIGTAELRRRLLNRGYEKEDADLIIRVLEKRKK